MTAILNARWHGIAALIWSLCGYGVTALVPRSTWEHFLAGFMIWLFLGWLGPALLLAISGVRRGPVMNRVCAALVLVAYVVLVASVVLGVLAHTTKA